jgi:hypothetical protein
MTREVLQQALEALVTAEAGLADIGDADREPTDDLAWCEERAAQALAKPRAAIAALKAALAQPEQEPVAWGIVASNTGRICQVKLDADEVAGHKPEYIKLLYTSPPRRQPLPRERTDAFYQALSQDDRSKQFTVQNWFQAGFATSEAAHGIGDNK